MSCVKPTATVTKTVQPENSDDEEQILPTHHSIGDVLSEALQANKAHKGAAGGSKKTKKNNKKTLLFTSGMNYKGT